jgi:hypothetical protein
MSEIVLFIGAGVLALVAILLGPHVAGWWRIRRRLRNLKRDDR